MTDTSQMNSALLAALAQAQIERIPVARMAFWPNTHRREGKNDSTFTGRVQISTVKLAEKLAAALAEGKAEIELWADLWANQPDEANPNRPVLSGRARNFVEPQAQATEAEAAQG